MSEPDELYTLRAQFWLGHYGLAVEEARSVARRPMSPLLKEEREDFLARANIALGNFGGVGGTTPALQALGIKAQYDAASGNEAAQAALLDSIKSLAGSHASDHSVQLTTSQMLLAAGQVKEALQCVYSTSSTAATSNVTMEHGLMALQIYLRIDRLDLARQQLSRLRASDEDSVLTQLGSVYLNLATGSTGAAEAVHALNSLSEQYGPSPMLLNLVACALMQQGDYAGAELKLQECIKDFSEFKTLPDTLINLICCLVQQSRSAAPVVQEMQSKFPKHPYSLGLERVVQAFDREAVKYMM